MLSKKKYERFLYILLSAYTLLVMIFMLLLNGFFVKSKAYNGNFPITKFRSKCEIDGSLGIVDLTFTASNNSKVIYIVDENDLNNEPSYIYLFGTPNLIGDLVVNQSNGYGWYSSVLYTYNKYAANDIIGNGNFFDEDLIGYRITLNSLNNGQPFITDFYETSNNIEYVNSFEDAKKYIYKNDDSVVNTGNPINPPLPEDDSLPVPQALTLDLKNNENAYPPFLSGSWSNPNSLLASYDASDVQIEVQYKPNFQYYKKIFDIKLGSGQSDDWISVNTDSIDNFKKWTIVLNNSNNLPPDGDGVYVRSGSDDIAHVASQHSISNYSNHVESLNGTKWRCRYIVGNKTSLWVVYGLKSINKFGRPSLSGDEVTFENASGDPVSAEDVKYTNSSYTEQDYDSMSFLGKIRYDIDNLFTSLKSFFIPQDQGNGFYGFFGRVFEQFPIFWALFVLGLVVAILLRIFGR